MLLGLRRAFRPSASGGASTAAQAVQVVVHLGEKSVHLLASPERHVLCSQPSLAAPCSAPAPAWILVPRLQSKPAVLRRAANGHLGALANGQSWRLSFHCVGGPEALADPFDCCMFARYEHLQTLAIPLTFSPQLASRWLHEKGSHVSVAGKRLSDCSFASRTTAQYPYLYCPCRNLIFGPKPQPALLLLVRFADFHIAVSSRWT